MRTVGVLLIERFEPLDVFGPVEAFICAPDEAFRVVMVGEGTTAMSGGPRVVPDASLADSPALDLLLVPGGLGTRQNYHEGRLHDFLREQAGQVEVLASVCTGAALLGAAGLLRGLEATTNRRAFDWVVSVSGPDIRWNRQARWVDEGRIITSAGISAGTDMALYLVSRLCGLAAAEEAEARMEYRWERQAQ